jgi:hypothetical protein
MVSGQQLCYLYEINAKRTNFTIELDLIGLVMVITPKNNMAPYRVLIVDRIFFVEVFI